MSLKTIQALLDLAALCNSHCNHGFEFEFCRLEDSTPMQKAIDVYFSSLVDYKTQRTHIAAEWHIEIKPIQGCVYQELVLVIQSYLFGLHIHLSSREEVHESLRKEVAEMICKYISEEVGDEFMLFEVTTKPPIFYEMHWRDFLIASRKGNWLFHIADNS